MKKIMIATDFSQCAGNAMEYALDLATLCNGEVSVIHAIHPTEGIDNNVYNSLYITEYYEAKKKALEAWIEAYKTEARYSQLTIKTVCEVGFLADMLEAQISAEAPDLLVMGTMGATGIGTLLGSNASMITSKVRIPTLLIPLGQQFKPKAKFVLASDFSENSLQPMAKFLNDFLEICEITEIDVVSVLEGTDKPSKNDEIELLKPLVNASARFHYIHDTSPIKAIDNYIEGNEIEILCTVKHHQSFLYRLFFNSRTKALANQALTTILVLHD